MVALPEWDDPFGVGDRTRSTTTPFIRVVNDDTSMAVTLSGPWTFRFDIPPKPTAWQRFKRRCLDLSMGARP